MGSLDIAGGLVVGGATLKDKVRRAINGKLWICFACWLMLAARGRAAIIEQVGGVFPNWPASWTAVDSLNDPLDAGVPAHLDFVGSASAPTVSYAVTDDFLFFQVQMAYSGAVTTGANPTYKDTVMLLIDVVGYRHPDVTVAGSPDFAFAWDSKSAGHGLEMMVPDPLVPSTWSNVRMNDLDDSNQKLSPPDFGAGDGYVRTLDQQPTDLGNTTLIQFAISRSYLQTQVPDLISNSLWRIQFGSIANGNDHIAINADIAGAAGPNSPLLDSWSAPINTSPSLQPPYVIPEPSVAVFWLLGGFWWWWLGPRRGR